MRHICNTCGHTEEREVPKGTTPRRYRHKQCPSRPGWMEPKPQGRPRLKEPTITRGIGLSAADWDYVRSVGDGYAQGLRWVIRRHRAMTDGGPDK